MMCEIEPLSEVNAGLPRPDWPGLVTRIQRGDQDALGELYHILTGGMRYYLCRMLGPQDLEDRLHDCFLLIARAIRKGEVREPERLMGFARTIVRRQIAGHIASAMDHRRREVDPDNAAPQASSSPNPESAAISSQHEKLATSALKALRPRDREVLTRFYVDEHSPEQICKDMCLTATQFRLLKTRAKTRFGEFGKHLLSVHNLPLAVN